MKNRSKHRRGFTFLEIMFVVVIIGIIMSIAAHQMAGTGGEVRGQAALASMKNIQAALAQFELRTGRFPTTSEGLEALVERPSTVPESQWPRRFLAEFPVDPWGNPFNYRSPGTNGQDYDLWSNGPDGREGTEDDIHAWRD